MLLVVEHLKLIRWWVGIPVLAKTLVNLIMQFKVITEITFTNFPLKTEKF